MRLSALLLPLVFALPLIAQAQTAEQVAIRADDNLRGYGDVQMQLEMTLISPSGETANRSLRVRSREADAGTDQTLMTFDTPRDLAGSGLLSHNRASGEDEQWLYLPAVKRIKQIGARNKSGPFMGSEFAFEDIVTPFWQKFHYQSLTEESLDGLPCFTLERIPNDSYSGYTRQRLWIDKEQYLIRRIEYFDRKNALLKTYNATDFQQYAGQYWRPGQMLMVNQQTGKQTRLQWRDFSFHGGLSERDFSQNALLRVR
ncbi:MAG: outer membrane lipoprotein-sorting protein [Pseudomonas sp.]|uniref:outer membrane lipoprotein-sorting protein n=1 Tax=Pseudomonas sp. TaxID=306 RepID=UPI002736711D|nr:outer membrane lipoprotein-sorting protein [Pseudomonas sp.]MDP3847856.1 outer membrane lipoprotein-sorting protein [Pseudomonas sp.]